MNKNRTVHDGWTAQDHIEELEPMIAMIMNGNSIQKPFKSKRELSLWCRMHQTEYHFDIPEVINYFFTKYMK